MWHKDDIHQEIYDMEEEMERREDQMRFAAGMSDFFSIVLGVILILILILLLISLGNWLRHDIRTTVLSLDIG
jgi:uncharacterized membrane protein YkgB